MNEEARQPAMPDGPEYGQGMGTEKEAVREPQRIRRNLPMSREELRALRIGERLLLNGYLYTARDAAHKRLYELLLHGQALPVDLTDGTIYYAGPCPAPPGQIIGSAGPTTSGRVDRYTPLLLANGLSVMIGKGDRDDATVQAMVRHSAVYLGATGGAGALIARCIRSAETVAFDDLGTEAIRRLLVEDFPVTVLIDTTGANLYKTNPVRYKIP